MRTLTILLERARELRHQQTNAEVFIWRLLRNRQLAGAKFRRQHPLEGYVADFYCHEHKLVIELDGGQHFTEQAIIKDQIRTERLSTLGIRVLRFDNRQVFLQTEEVLEQIHRALTQPSPRGRGL